MKTMKIKSIGSNMTLLETDRYHVLFSYETPVAFWDSETATFARTARKWSVTTSRHINKWLDGREAEVLPQEQIEAVVPQ
jgi:hypothetical protein